MWSKLKKFLLKKSDNLIGIDIGTGALKLVEIIWEKDRPVLKNFAIKQLPNNIVEDGRIIDSQQLTEILRELLASINVTTQNVVVGVGGKSMFARELIFPTMTMIELAEAIKWDLEKHIPYAPDSYYYDFAIVGKGTTDKEIKVLLVASPIENVTNIMTIIESIGLKLIAVDAEPLALYRIFTGAEKSMVIDVGALISQVTVFQNGSPAVMRNIPIGGRNFSNIIMQALEISLPEAEQIKYHEVFLSNLDISNEYIEVKQQMEMLVDEFVRDVRRTAEYYQQENQNAIIDKVLITGGGAKLANLMGYLSSQTYLPTVLYNPLDQLIIPSNFDKESLQAVAPELCTAIGLALRGGKK